MKCITAQARMFNPFKHVYLKILCVRQYDKLPVFIQRLYVLFFFLEPIEFLCVNLWAKSNVQPIIF